MKYTMSLFCAGMLLACSNSEPLTQQKKAESSSVTHQSSIKAMTQSCNPKVKGTARSVWQKYLSIECDSPLIDFSAVGVNYANAGIPDFKLPQFSVVDYGAVPNDRKEDKQAIQQAIDAATKAGGGIVLFPPGRFLLNERPGQTHGINIAGSHVILRGSGNNQGGTELFMKYPLLPKDPTKLYTVPPMFVFNPKWVFNLPSSVIVENTPIGANYVVVENAKRFRAGNVVRMEMQSTAANEEYLKGHKTRKIWTQINNKGVKVAETLRIADVNENTIVFEQPLLTNINAAHGWKIKVRSVIEYSGVENLKFSGNFQDKFVHHKDAVHDSGYNAIELQNTIHSWVKNVVFKDVSIAVTLSGGLANTAMLNVIEGNRGHSSFNVTLATRNLVALNIDKTNEGQWHGPGASNQSVGNVFWRFISPMSRGVDSHAAFPRFTLFDNITSNGFGGWGGSYTNLPNHLEGLVFWNFVQTGDVVGEHYKGKFNFWDTNYPDKVRYSFYTAVDPILVGYEGSAEGFVAETFGEVESFGKKVTEPASLFEAQLRLRHGKTPAWLSNALADWQQLQATHLP